MTSIDKDRALAEYLTSEVQRLDKAIRNLEDMVGKQGNYLNNIQKDMADNEE